MSDLRALMSELIVLGERTIMLLEQVSESQFTFDHSYLIPQHLNLTLSANYILQQVVQNAIHHIATEPRHADQPKPTPTHQTQII